MIKRAKSKEEIVEIFKESTTKCFTSYKQNADGEEITIEFPDKTNIEQVVINEKILMEVAKNFDDDEKELIREVLIEGVSATEFGRRKGQTQQNISKKIKKIKEKLKNFNIF